MLDWFKRFFGGVKPLALLPAPKHSVAIVPMPRETITQAWHLLQRNAFNPNSYSGLGYHQTVALFDEIISSLEQRGAVVCSALMAEGSDAQSINLPAFATGLIRIRSDVARDVIQRQYAPLQRVEYDQHGRVWMAVLLVRLVQREQVVGQPTAIDLPDFGTRRADPQPEALLDDLLTAYIPDQPSYPAPKQVFARPNDVAAVEIEESDEEEEPILDGMPEEIEDDETGSWLDDLEEEDEEEAVYTPQLEMVRQETPRDHIRLGETAEGQAVSFPIAALGGAMVVAFGIPRMGKTTSLESLVYQSSKLGLPWGIVYDQKSEWRGLRHGTDALPFLIGGANQYADVRLPTFGLDPEFESDDETEDQVKQTLRAWARLATWGLQNGQSVILDSGSVDIGTTGRRDILRTVAIYLNRIAQQHRQPYGVLIDEAQDAWPQGYLGARDLEAAMSIVRTAPSYGLTTVLAAHRPTDVDKRLLAPARLRILHRVDMARDLNAYADMLPWQPKQVTDTTMALRPGEAIVYGPALGIREPVVVRMDAAPTYHVGYTPAVGVTPPREPNRLVLPSSLIESAAQVCRGVVEAKPTPITVPLAASGGSSVEDKIKATARMLHVKLPMGGTVAERIQWVGSQQASIVIKVAKRNGIASVRALSDLLFVSDNGTVRTALKQAMDKIN